MRGKKAPKRTVQPDKIYESQTVTRFINAVMLSGKKSQAMSSVYEAMAEAANKTSLKPIEMLGQSLSNVKPSLEVRSRRVGGATYQVPAPIDDARQETLALKWIIKAARSKKGGSFVKKLTDELVNACKGEGDAVRMRADTERMAEANKAFAHFRW